MQLVGALYKSLFANDDEGRNSQLYPSEIIAQFAKGKSGK